MGRMQLLLNQHLLSNVCWEISTLSPRQYILYDFSRCLNNCMISQSCLVLVFLLFTHGNTTPISSHKRKAVRQQRAAKKKPQGHPYHGSPYIEQLSCLTACGKKALNILQSLLPERDATTIIHSTHLACFRMLPNL